MTYRDDLPFAALLERCRDLRKSSTTAEALLWRLLRNRQLAEAKFRRQHQYGPYILDFYCYKHKLVIEVDGGHHNLPEQAEEDLKRTAYLASRGLKVLRFTNPQVLQEVESVLLRIWEEMERPSPQPSPRGRGSSRTSSDS